MKRDPADMEAHDEIVTQLGRGLRRLREEQGLNPEAFSQLLPSHIGANTIRSYEKTERSLSVRRFLEICLALGKHAPDVLDDAIMVSQVGVEHRVINVDLTALVQSKTPRFRYMQEWARNKLVQDDTVTSAEVTPPLMQEWAVLMRCTPHQLAQYLLTFSVD